MRRLLAPTFALGLALGLTACGGANGAPAGPEPSGVEIKKSVVFDFTQSNTLNEVDFTLSDGRIITCIVLEVERGGGLHCLEEDGPR